MTAQSPQAPQTRARRNGDGSKPRWREALGVWEARYHDLDGIRRSVYARTETECLAKQRVGIGERDRGMPSEDHVTRVRSWLATWLDAIPESRIRTRTRRRYSDAIRLQWDRDPIADRKLAELRPEHVGAAIGRMHRAGLSTASQAFALAVLRMALDAAVRSGHVGRNVARLIDAPRAEPREIAPPRGDELARLGAAIDAHRLRALWRLCLDAGLREGEALGLTWGDLELDARGGMVHVRGTLQYGSQIVGAPKSRSSARDLPIGQTLAAVLIAYRDQKYPAGVSPFPRSPVFATSSGRFMHARNVLGWWHDLCTAAGVKRYRIHDLRHAFATGAIERGHAPALVMGYLGHADLRMTSRYVHAGYGTLGTD